MRTLFSPFYVLVVIFGLVLLCASIILIAARSAKPTDAMFIAFTSERDSDAFFQRMEIYRMLPDGSDVRRLTTHRGAYVQPNWSPDGRWIAFTDTFEIYRVAFNGGPTLRITNDSSAIKADPRWSPDGAWIAFTAQVGTDVEIFRVRPDGSDLQRLTNHPDQDVRAVWSPDGRWIGFLSNRGEPDFMNVFRMKPDGTGLARVSQAAAPYVSLEWSIDGLWLYLYQRNTGLFRMLADGGAPERVNDAALTGTYNRSPNGAWLAFAYAIPYDVVSDIYRIRPDGTDRQQLTDHPEQDAFPAWSPVIDKSWHSLGLFMLSVGMMGASGWFRARINGY